jgi:hypothetical protein
MPLPSRADQAAAIVIAALVATAPFALGAHAQSLFDASPPPVVGGSGLAPPPLKPAFGGMSGPTAQLHHDVYGRVCVSIDGYSEAQKNNPDIFNHMLLFANRCSMPIKLHVCYYQSEHCIDVVAPPYGRTLETLGIFPHMEDFRWAYSERFN